MSPPRRDRPHAAPAAVSSLFVLLLPALLLAIAASAAAEVRHEPGAQADLYEAYLDFAIGGDEAALERALALRGETSFLVFQQARVAGRLGDQREMIARAERAVELDGANHEARDLLARAYFRLADAGLDADGRFLEKAIGHARALLEAERLQPDVADALARAHAEAARVALAEGDFDEATRRRSLQREVLVSWARTSGDREAWRRLAELAQELGDDESEVEALTAELARTPENVIVVQRVAELLSSLQRCEEALPLLERATALDGLDVYASISLQVHLGECALAVGETSAAETAYRAALGDDPTSLVAARGLAESLRRQGRGDEARAVFDAVVERGGRPSAASEELARWLLAHDELAAARAAARKALTLRLADEDADHRDVAETRALLGEILLDAGELDAAAEQAAAILRSDPSHDGAVLLEATVEWGRDRRAAARRALERPDAVHDLAFLTRRAHWFLRRGLAAEAIASQVAALEAAREARTIAPGRLADLERGAALLFLQAGDARRALEVARIAHRRAPGGFGARAVVAEALQALGRGEEARAELDEVLDHGSPWSLVARSRWEAEHHRPDAAVELADEAWELVTSPQGITGSRRSLRLAPFALGRARAAMDARRPQEALEWVERAFVAEQPSPVAVLTRVEALEALGRFEDAVTLLERSRAGRGDVVALALAHVRALAAAGRVDEALALAEEGIAAVPGSAVRARRFARALDVGGAAVAAERVVERALERFPGDGGLHLLAGVLHEQAGRLDRAEAELRVALRDEAVEAAAANSLGYLLAERGVRLDEAIALIERALAQRPDDPAYLDSLGWALFQQGKVEAAAEHLEAAVARSRDPVIVMHVGTLREAQGRRGEALQLYREALRFGLDEEVPRVERRVEELAASSPRDRGGERPVDVEPGAGGGPGAERTGIVTESER